MPQPTRGGALWLDNWVLSSSIAAVSGQQQNFPARNLLNPHRSDRWWSKNDAATDLVLDLGAPRLPECFAIVGANFAGSGAVRLRGSDDAAQETNAASWDLPLYAHDPTGQVLRWYLGAPTTGTAAPRRFWGVRFRPNILGPYTLANPWFSMAVVWLGTFVPFTPAPGIRIRPKDSSRRSLSYGRSRWSDPGTPYREADVPLDVLSIAELDTLEAAIRALGSRPAILDLHAFSSDVVLTRGGCLYGTFPADAFDGEVRSADGSSARFRFEEATA